jgi:hypothetical protein
MVYFWIFVFSKSTFFNNIIVMNDENEKKKFNAFYIKYASHFYLIEFEFNVIWIRFIFKLNIFELN